MSRSIPEAETLLGRKKDFYIILITMKINSLEKESLVNYYYPDLIVSFN